MFKAILVLFFLRSVLSTGSTEGDQDEWFQNCTKKCNIERRCNQSDNAFDLDTSKSIFLVITFWNCEYDCRYVCTREHNDMRIKSGKEIVQYFGKWPFVRLFGFQELASSVFSMGNMIAHLNALITYYHAVPKSYYLRYQFLGSALLGCFTWTFSFLFHCRDIPATEFLDYSFASLTFFYGSYLATVRIFETKGTNLYIVTGIFVLWVIQHWRYMFFIDFDYAYNMNIGILNGVFQFVAWGCWYILKGRKDAEYNYKIVLAYGLIGLAGTMELFDFPPIFEIIDPHSLWHLGTIGCFVLMWNFFVLDSINEDKKESSKIHIV